MLNVVDRPILSYIVAEGRAAGIEHFVFVTGRGRGGDRGLFRSPPQIEGTAGGQGQAEILAEIRADLPRPGEMSFVRQMAPGPRPRGLVRPRRDRRRALRGYAA
jgi:UTP--glucose-1-phosphate uridylyltransferase